MEWKILEKPMKKKGISKILSERKKITLEFTYNINLHALLPPRSMANASIVAENVNFSSEMFLAAIIKSG